MRVLCRMNMYDVMLLIFVVENMAVINVIIIIRLCVSQFSYFSVALYTVC